MKKILLACILFISGGYSLVKAESETKPAVQPNIVEETNQNPQEIQSLKKGVMAPAIVLRDSKGKEVSLKELKGKNIYINFWASWCAPCIDELEKLERLYQQFKGEEGLVFLSATSANDKKFSNTMPLDASSEEILQIAKSKGITYPVLFDFQGDTFKNYQIQVFPTHILIDKEGKIANVIIGEIPAEILEKELKKMK